MARAASGDTDGNEPVGSSITAAVRTKEISAPLRRRFAIHLWLAARWLPMTAKRRDIEPLLLAATPEGGHAPYRGLSSDEIVAAVRSTLARPWRMRGRRCLRESLLAFRFLRLAGHPAVIHFAVAPGRSETDRLRAHAWVSLDGICLLDPPGPEMIALYDWDGAAHPVHA
jgi:hypothetical protein